MIARQKIWLALVLAVNAALWLIPSDVLANVARDQQTLLGRYSRTHFAWNLGVLALSVVSFYVDWSTGQTYKRRWFQVIATLLFLVPTLAVVDWLLRTESTMHYVREGTLYHRPPGGEFRQTFTDRPEAYRTYPNAPPGYGTVACVARVDKRGYRNPSDLDQCDIVTLGDSFTEGSSVSDEHPWPVRLARDAGVRVCNLGMSGYDPFHYLESLRQVGLGLKPKVVICMLYEGNDFRSAASDAKRRSPSFSKRMAEYMDRSPLVKAIDGLITRTFAPLVARRPLRGAEVLDWLPVYVPEGDLGRPYAFEPKQLRDLLQTEESFARDKHWHNPREQVAEMNRLCREAGARFLLVLAPTKAHVLLPLAADRLDPAKVRAFAAIDYRKPLPDPEAFVPELLSRVDAKEKVIANWCRSEEILFFSPTPALRERMLAGVPVYYTYDQHWTPEGHAAVSAALQDFLTEQSLLPLSAVTRR